MPSVAQTTVELRAEVVAAPRPAGLPGLARRAVGFGAELFRALGRYSAAFPVGCLSNDGIDLMLNLEQRVHAAEQALAAHIRLTTAQVADLTVELGIARAQLDEFYIGAGVDAAIADVRGWEGSIGLTTTVEYAVLHNAFAYAAHRYRQRPVVARVAFALLERKGSATSHELEDDLGLHGSAVRRALLEMYAAGLADGVAADGLPRRRGIVTRASLLPEGRAMASLVASIVRNSRREPVAA